VLFAGSRFCDVPQRTCQELIQALAHLGFSFYIGCADGVDRSFRGALTKSPYRERCFVGCAFPHRVKHSYSYGLFASCAVPKNLPSSMMGQAIFVYDFTYGNRTIHYRVIPSRLFGVVKGYWVVPYPISDEGRVGMDGKKVSSFQ